MSPSAKEVRNKFNETHPGALSLHKAVFIGNGRGETRRGGLYRLITEDLLHPTVKMRGEDGRVITISPNADLFTKVTEE